MARLFGTDGVRGVANSELTCELAMNIGRAAATVLAQVAHRRPRIVIGKDTRVSSDMLEAALVAGLCSVGADVHLLGVVPTPAVAYLIKQYGMDAGVMISASHNPFEFNGIKVFNADGYKLSDALEDQIESLVKECAAGKCDKSGDQLGRVHKCREAVRDYTAHIASTVKRPLGGLRIALDCANGSASITAPTLFAQLGAECEILSAAPSGTNINDACGSTHMGVLSRFVRENGCDVGFAFDGDADRCLAVDENGELIDGDRLIAVFAASLHEAGQLPGDTAVVTVMSNLGFHRFADGRGIQTVVTSVGDRYVLESMVEHGYAIGGEQSGHIIFAQHATTGDGQLTAVQFLSILLASGKKASELASVMEIFPQVLVNIKAGTEAKARLNTDSEVQASVAAAENELGKDGRVLLRASGTEPLIRVMIEGRSQQQIDRLANGIADVIRARLCGE